MKYKKIVILFLSIVSFVAHSNAEEGCSLKPIIKNTTIQLFQNYSAIRNYQPDYLSCNFLKDEFILEYQYLKNKTAYMTINQFENSAIKFFSKEVLKLISPEYGLSKVDLYLLYGAILHKINDDNFQMADYDDAVKATFYSRDTLGIPSNIEGSEIGLSKSNMVYLDMNKLQQMSDEEVIYYTTHELFHSVDREGLGLMKIKDYIESKIDLSDYLKDQNTYKLIEWLYAHNYFRFIQWSFLVPINKEIFPPHLLSEELLDMYYSDYLELVDNDTYLLTVDEFNNLFLFLVWYYADTMYHYIREFRATKAGIALSAVSCFGAPYSFSEITSDIALLKLTKYNFILSSNKINRIKSIFSNLVFERLSYNINKEDSCQFCDIIQNLSHF